jgi:histidine triad (HIT) family protein
MWAGDILVSPVAQTKTVLVLADINPQAPTHWLFIHKIHTTSVADTLDDTLLADLLATARDTAKHHGLTDYRLVFNTGPQAGQSVLHTHLHLLAGRPLTWPPG